MENLADLEIASKSTFTEFNVRQERGKPHFVRLHDNVVKRLEGQLEQHPCGLLLGSIEPGDGCTIAVEEFEPAALMAERVKTWRAQAGSRGTIVGCYRSHSRSGFTLDAADRALFERCFPKEQRLLLLVKPPKSEVGTAMFFLGEAGQLLVDRATVEFPFNLRELGAEDAPAQPQPEVIATPIIVQAGPVAPAAAPVKTPAPVVQSATAPVKATQPAMTPAKTAEPKTSGLLWKIAVAGVVVIASGFGLSELKVFDRHTAQDQPAPAVVETRASAGAPQEMSPASREAESSKPAPSPEPAKSAKSPAPSPQKAGTAMRPATTSKAASPTAPLKPAPQPAVPGAQPVLVAQNPIPAPSLSVQPAAEVPTPAPPADPLAAIRTGAQPTPAAPSPAVVRSAPSVAIMPPRAIQQIAPELPAKALKSIVGEVVVRLKVNVDASGKVTSTEPVSSGSIDPAVMGAVSTAVKRWKFAPARQGSQNVAGDLVLSFVFRK